MRPVRAKSPPTVLSCEGLAKSYGQVEALSDVSLIAYPGEIVGLLGPNGAGKSTFLRLCEGRDFPTDGRITVLGLERRLGGAAAPEPIGVLLQKPAFSAYATVAETVDLFSTIARRGREPRALIDRLGLSTKRSERISRLSGGQRQRLGLLVALIWNSPLLLLDEPTSELDPQGRRIVWDLIREEARERGTAVLISTHQMEEAAALCDRVYILDNGKVVATGSPAAIINTHCPSVDLHLTVNRAYLAEVLRIIPESDYILSGDAAIFTVSCNTKQDAIDILSSFLHSNETGLLDVRIDSQTLEDVFFRLTGTYLRA